MRFLEVSEQGGRYVTRLRETETPVAGPGEVLIRVAASGVNRADLAQIAGRYPPPPGESTILGMEASGTIEATGERVCVLLAGGGDAEYVAAPVGQVFPAPPGLDLASAAGIPEAFLTAFVTLVLEAGLGARRTALDRKSTRLNSSHSQISYAVFCLKKKKKKETFLSSIKKKKINKQYS